jgi:hypothetical protein
MKFVGEIGCDPCKFKLKFTVVGYNATCSCYALKLPFYCLSQLGCFSCFRWSPSNNQFHKCIKTSSYRCYQGYLLLGLGCFWRHDASAIVRRDDLLSYKSAKMKRNKTCLPLLKKNNSKFV